MALPELLWIWLLVAGTHGLEDGTMRLVNGDSANEGRVEVFYRGQWGTVCDDGWDLDDAHVVCRALGFENATQVLRNAAFGQGTGPIMLDDVECVGTEPSLGDCKSQGWLQSNCGHQEDAGVICNNKTAGVYTLDFSSELSEALSGIFDSQQGCDLSIQVLVGGKEALSICAHTLILSANPEAQSLVRKSEGKVTMEVDTECVPLVEDFIRYLYTRRLNVSLKSVKCFHQVASAHGAKQLQDYCAHLFAAVIPQDPSFWTTLDLHAYALATSDALLEALCVQFLAWNFEALTKVEAWPRVPVALLHTLLSRSELAVSSELALLKAVDTWGQENHASHGVMAGLLEGVRFPMMPPTDLFELQFNVTLFHDHESFFQKKMLQALQFHTVPFQLLAQHQDLNLSQDAYRPRLYMTPTWSASVSGDPHNSRLAATSRRDAYFSKYSYYTPYPPAPSGYRYYPFQSFQTPQHPSFLFHSTFLSWSLSYLPTVQSCWNYGFSCSPDEVPALGLTRSDYPDPAIGYENKALMLCSGRFVATVTDFRGQKASIPSALSTNGSSNVSFFPCPTGSFNSFYAIIRPFYLTNSSDVC
ncbi:galectin-3-binding protein [Loxodonta africana]|uniref:galectin-3-binding protein n=1 Tax=Loxodonta africana TaxID=9785 RepID=UPI0030D32311